MRTSCENNKIKTALFEKQERILRICFPCGKLQNSFSYKGKSVMALFTIIPTRNVLQENKNIVITSNDTSADEEMSTIQDFIEAQRPENTTR